MYSSGMHTGVCIPACTWQRGCVSQHALGRGCMYPSMHGQGVCVSQHALGRECVYPSMHWAGGVSQHALHRGCVYPTMHWARGVCIPACTGWGGVSQHALDRGCLPRGVFAQGEGVCPGGVADTTHPPRTRGRHPPWTDRHL